MIWLYLVIIAQFLNAIVTLVDKHLVTAPTIGKPVVYTFYIGILSGAAVLLLPLGLVSLPSPAVAWLSLASGIIFIFSLLFLYKSLKISAASDVAPVAGGVNAVSALVFSAILLGGSPSGNFLLSFILLVAGTLIISRFRLSRRAVLFVLASGALFGLWSVLVKEIFSLTDFWNGFFWSRMTNALGAMLLLVIPSNLGAVLNNLKSSSVKTKSAVVLNKILAGAAFVLILYAIKLGDVSLINALAGAQFAFILIIGIMFSGKLPEHFSEKAGRRALMQKLLANILIILGLFFLFI